MNSQLWCIALAVLILSCGDRARFDGPTWRTTDCIDDSYAGDTYREYVVDDLVEKILPGMSRDSVMALLGPADTFTDSLIVYCLGPQSPLGVDFYWLSIYFDANMMYSNSRVWHD